MTEGSWSRTYGYDQWGNGWVSAWTGISLDPFTPTGPANYNAQNRLLILGSSYDGAGNQTAIGGYGNTYDAENRLRTSTINGATTTYSYDGNGRRAKKEGPAGTWLYLYDAQGQLAAEYGPASGPDGLQYLTPDHLGSTRLVTDSSGVVTERHDYQPFGEEMSAGINGRTTEDGYPAASPLLGSHVRFTGKERDAETGLDFFGARYFFGAQGRFTSPDPVIITPERFRDPQQLNRYAYVRNNPLRFVDPTGEDLYCTGDDKAACFEQLKQIAGDAASRVSLNKTTGLVSFNAEGFDFGQNEGASLINDLVTSTNAYGLTIGSSVQTAGGSVPVDLTSNLPPAFDQLARVGRRGRQARSNELPLSPLTDQIAVNPNAAPRSDEQGRRVAVVSYVFHELAEAYAKIDLGQPYASSFRVVNGMVQAGFLDPGAHDLAGFREDRWRQQSPSVKLTGRAADQLIVDRQSHSRRTR